MQGHPALYPEEFSTLATTPNLTNGDVALDSRRTASLQRFIQKEIRMLVRNFLRVGYVLPALVAAVAQAAIPATERNALIALYSSAGGASWSNNSGWNGTAGSECTWFGISCDHGSTHVLGIDLSTNNLSGPLPSLGDLPAITILDLHANYLTGSLATISSLTNLTQFVANSNQFQGSIPTLTTLTQLEFFDVDTNQLNGTLTSLTGLTHLIGFSAYANQLRGSIPALTGLTNLTSFNVHGNQLSGSIPTLADLIGLNSFDVNSNQLSGSIPSLSGLDALNNFLVGNNHLDGVLPTPPASLTPSGSSLCGNDFPAASYTASMAWDSATGASPWFSACKLIFVNGFEGR
jgi:hypothetical protein